MDKENGLLWTRVILETYTRLPQFARSFDRAGSALVKSSLITGNYGSGYTTEELFERMIELNYRKSGIVNLKVLTDQALRRIEPLLANVLQARFFLKLDFETIAQKENIARRTIFRKVERGMEKFYENRIPSFGSCDAALFCSLYAGSREPR